MKRNKLYFLLMFFFFLSKHPLAWLYSFLFSHFLYYWKFLLLWHHLDNQHTFKPEIFIYYAERRLVPKHAELLTSLFAFIIERPTTTILALTIPNKRKWNRQADRQPNSQAYNIKNIKSTNQFEHYVLYKTINKHHHPIDILNKTFAYLLVISIWPWCNNHTHNYKFFFWFPIETGHT